MKKLAFFLMALVICALPCKAALPFEPTTSPDTKPIHWYQIKTGNLYLYAGNNSGYTELMGSTTQSTSDAYLWCFVGTASTGYKIYNRATKSYMVAGTDFGTATDSSVNYYEAGSGNNFYIYTMLTPWGSTSSIKNYLIYYNNELYTTRNKYNSYTAVEVFVEYPPQVTDKPTLSMTVEDESCIITASGKGTVLLYLDNDLKTNPCTVPRKNFDYTVTATATAKEDGKEMSSYTTTYIIPAQEKTEDDFSMSIISVNTPHNSLSNYGEEGVANLFDNNNSTKWCVVNPSGSWETISVDFLCKTAFYPITYVFTTANDTQSYPNRNPKSWKIYGKAKQNDNWTTIANVTDGKTAGLGSNNKADYTFPFDSCNDKYMYFRFEVSAVGGEDNWDPNNYVFQLAELKLNGVTTAVKGDVNGDGEIDVKDVTALISYILGGKPQGFMTINANVNNDAKGDIDVQDVTAIINLILN